MNEFLFLDVDDVLNSEEFLRENSVRENDVDPDEHPGEWIDPKAVERVNKIMDRTDTYPEIILSSSWRHSFDVTEMTDILRDRGFNHNVSDKTPGRPKRIRHVHARPKVPVRDRGVHIKNFLKHKRSVSSVESVLVLDNLPLEELEPLEDYVVQTEPEHGLQDEHVEKALDILEKTPSFEWLEEPTTTGKPEL